MVQALSRVRGVCLDLCQQKLLQKSISISLQIQYVTEVKDTPTAFFSVTVKGNFE